MDKSRLPLGKRPHVTDKRDLKLSAYIADMGRLLEVSQAPAASDWTQMPTPAGTTPAPDTDSLGNDVLGCCVYAAPAHQVRLMGQLTGNPSLRPGRGDVIDAYSRYTGYNPVTGEGDNGAYTRDMLKVGQNEGLYGAKIVAYVAVDPKNADEVTVASWVGCGLIRGYSLPVASQLQEVWDVPVGGWPAGKGPGTWGGHCIFGQSTSPRIDDGNSWGLRQPWTAPWRCACCDELYLALWNAWQMTSRAPNGIAWADILADVAARKAAT
jgi:hypothetical protein